MSIRSLPTRIKRGSRHCAQFGRQIRADGHVLSQTLKFALTPNLHRRSQPPLFTPPPPTGATSISRQSITVPGCLFLTPTMAPSKVNIALPVALALLLILLLLLLLFFPVRLNARRVMGELPDAGRLERRPTVQKPSSSGKFRPKWLRLSHPAARITPFRTVLSPSRQRAGDGPTFGSRESSVASAAPLHPRVNFIPSFSSTRSWYKDAHRHSPRRWCLDLLRSVTGNAVLS
jgi:hypothetical protein